MSWLTPVTNWDGSSPSRTYYNAADLNRVENNINELVTLINTYSSIGALTSITSRNTLSIDFYDSLNRVENNIQALATATNVPLNWQTPTTDWVGGTPFDYEDANRLESNVLELYTMINKIKDYLMYAGGINAICGNDNSIL